MAEAAGLALAVFPLVVKGIVGYIDAAHTIQEVLRWKIGMKGLLRDMKVEKVLFENTCANVLKDTFHDDQVVLLLRGEGWDEVFQQHLRECWGEGSADIFIEGVKRMGVTLVEVQKELGFDNVMLLDEPDKHSRRKKWKQILAILRRGDCLQEIKKINGQLERLANQLPPSVRKFSGTSTAMTKYCEARKYAIGLHDILQQRLQDTRQCGCKTPHKATLRLPRVRGRDEKKVLMPVRFEVLFPFDGTLPEAGITWRGLEFKPCTAPVVSEPTLEACTDVDVPIVAGTRAFPERTTPPGKPPGTTSKIKSAISSALASVNTKRTRTHKKGVQINIPDKPMPATEPTQLTVSPREEKSTIDDLCSVIRTRPASLSTMSLGSLHGEGEIIWDCLPPRMAFPLETIRALPLDAVLRSGGLSATEALKLGVQIALAVMQLHTTQWLGEAWNKKDIFIFHRAVNREDVASGNRVTVWEPIIEHDPFVHRIFSPHSETQPCRSAAKVIANRDQSLFSLGIILIELALRKSIEDLRITYDPKERAQDDPDFETAKMCLGEVYFTQQPAYGDAVERCLRGPRLPKPIAQDLNNPQFKNEVQTQIVALLEQNLETYLGPS